MTTLAHLYRIATGLRIPDPSDTVDYLRFVSWCHREALTVAVGEMQRMRAENQELRRELGEPAPPTLRTGASRGMGDSDV